MQNLVNLPVSALKRAGGAVSSVANNVAASLPRLPGIRSRRGSSQDEALDDETIMKNCVDKLSLSLKSTPSKDCATTSALSVKSGHLMKRNEQGNWHRVVACVVPHWFLYYFDSESADSPKGVIDLHFYMKMMIENGNVLKISSDSISDGGSLRSYYFMDDDANVLSEWINCIHRERYQIVRDERDAYQQLQDQFSGEMASATMEIQESTIDKERLQLEIAHSRLAADDSLAAMQRVLVVIGVTEEEMRLLNTAPKASEAIIASIKRTRDQHDRILYDIEQRRQAERTKFEEHIAMLEKQLVAEKEAHQRSEAQMLAEQREFEQTVNREIRETLGKLDKANLNLQMAVAARTASEDKLSTLAEQKKLLVKEVKALRTRLQQVNETVENLLALNERAGIAATGTTTVAVTTAAATTTAMETGAVVSTSEIGTLSSSAATSTMTAPSAPLAQTSGSASTAGLGHGSNERLSATQLDLDEDEDEDDGPDDEEGSERESWAMSASALRELGWLSPEQRQLVETRAVSTDGVDKSNIVTMGTGTVFGARTTSGNALSGTGSIGEGEETSSSTASAGLAQGAPTASGSSSSVFSLGPFFSRNADHASAASAPATGGLAVGATSTSGGVGGGDANRRSSMTQLFGSLLGSSTSSSSHASADGASWGGVASSSSKSPENTVQAKVKIQSFFSSPVAEEQVDSPDRTPIALRLTCLRCKGTVEGPKYSTCKCQVPALKNEDMKDETGTNGAGSASSSSGGGIFTGMFAGMRRSSANMVQTLSLTATTTTNKDPLLPLIEDLEESVAL